MKKSLLIASLLAVAAASQPKCPALARCAANRDGECGHAECPQLRDGEPAKSGRHCPLDHDQEEA